jgi:lactoylglutathione lyase
MMMQPVIGFFHGGISVSDMDRSLTFYRDGLQLEVVVDRIANEPYVFTILAIHATELRIVYLKIPGTDAFIELIEFRGIERHPASARPCDPGAGHLCLYVSEISAIHQRLTERGFHSRAAAPELITSGPNKGARGVYFNDPDGYLIELFQRPPAAGLAAS